MRFQHRPRVYVAGPYSNGDPQTNTDNAIDWADKIVDLGGDPWIPHLSHYRHARHERPYRFWIEEDLRWLEVCDCLFRFPGKSSGAENEIKVMREKHHRPVFYDLEALEKWITTWNLAAGLERDIWRLECDELRPPLTAFEESAELAALRLHFHDLVKELEA